ncbi:MAG: hypothetical protein AAB152_14700 [Candidatus Coatesbacteria bacterium]
MRQGEDARARVARLAGPALGRASRVVRGWTAPTVLTFLDQGTSAGANFVLQIVLARRLLPEGYGAFAVAYALYLFLFGICTSILIEPMSLLGPRRHARDLAGYAVRLFRMQVALACLLGLALAASSLFYGAKGSSVATATVWFALSTPCLMGFQFLRRVCYLETAPASALKGSAVYAVVLLVALGWIGTGLSVATAITVMGGAALAGGAAILADRGLLPLLCRRSARWRLAWSDFAGCWEYGKWLLGIMVVGWFAGAAYVPLAAAVAGLSAAGTIRAIDNLFQPVSQGMTGLAMLASPWLARRMRERGAPFVRSRMWALGLTVAAGVSAYALILWWFGSRVISLAYGASTPYLAAAYLIPILGGVYVVRALGDIGLNTGLRAMGNFRVLFHAAVAGSIVMVGASILLIRAYGPGGAAAGMLLAGLTQLAVLIPASVARPHPAGVRREGGPA